MGRQGGLDRWATIAIDSDYDNHSHMADFTEAVNDTLRSGFCSVLGGVTNALNLARPFREPYPEGGAFPYLYNSLCNREPPSLVVPPPFTGGQCFTIAYNITGELSLIPNGGGSPTLLGWSTTKTGRVIGTSAPLEDGRYRAKITIQPSPGAGNQIFDLSTGGLASAFQSATSRITSVTPVNPSIPDSCGNPPPEPPPPLRPGDNIFNSSPTYINNEGDNISIPVTVVFGYANINANGSLVFPVSINFSGNPELNIDGDYNPGNTSNPFEPNPRGRGTNPSGNSGSDSEPDDDLPPDPLGEPDPGIPDPVDPENPEYEDVLVGVIVRATSIPNTVSRVFQDDNPDILIPDIGVVNFRYRVGKAGVWSEDFRIKNANQFVPVPPGYDAIEASGTPRFGVAWTITPVRSPRQKNPAFPTF